jgi:hypothetical protein
MRRVRGRIAILEASTCNRGRAADAWRIVLGPFVGTGEDDLQSDEADALDADLAATGERPTFAGLIAICQAVAAQEAA